MRDIRFRAWDTEEKEWITGGQVSIFQTALGFPKSVILEQFTGLKDKNGKGNEIYDKDIIGTPNGILYEVVWRLVHGQWWTKFFNTSHKGKWNVPLMEMAANGYLSIIGNVHENKELLNGNN